MGIGPELPPDFVRRTTAAAAASGEASSELSGSAASASPDGGASKRRRVMGPAGPPPSVRQLQSHVESNTRDDDDVFGPMPAPSSKEVDPEVELERKRLEIEARVANAVNNGSEGDADGESSDKPKTRGAWMLVPPEAKKLNADDVDQSGWTRLPGETKETNISLVRKEIAKPSATPLAESTSFDYDAVNEYNKVHRPKSLMEMHTAEYVSSTKFAENDASSRKFDRERDLGSRRTSAKARDNLVRGADQLNSRFTRG
ncbi:hypothetical protein HDU82_008163 [Entophlyctis luteolus]|nr:hypothetical protein HDU82_008163 [Entophlyctis luteolus]